MLTPSIYPLESVKTLYICAYGDGQLIVGPPHVAAK